MEIKLTGVSNLRSEYGDYDHDVILSNDLIESSGFVDIIIVSFCADSCRENAYRKQPNP